LISLCGLICLQVIFISTKSYTISGFNALNDSNRFYLELSNVTEDQYQSCLSSISNTKDRKKLIENTKIEYFYFLPEQAMLLIYLGYFLIATGLILSAKLNLIESSHEN
jgi:hypothetical protein